MMAADGHLGMMALLRVTLASAGLSCLMCCHVTGGIIYTSLFRQAAAQVNNRKKKRKSTLIE